jgi:ribosomal-protein-alanine N-acetyltransferase
MRGRVNLSRLRLIRGVLLVADSADAPLTFIFQRTARQLAALESIAKAWHSGPEQFWGYESVLSALSRPGSLLLFAAESADALVWSGAALVDVGPFSADLLYIYVRPEDRTKTIGRFLMDRVFQELAAKKEVEALFLEVRLSNVSAQKLYQKLDMELIGTRKRYYANGEDALIYKASFEETRG